MLVAKNTALIQLECNNCLIFLIKRQDLRNNMAGWNTGEFQVGIMKLPGFVQGTKVNAFLSNYHLNSELFSTMSHRDNIKSLLSTVISSSQNSIYVLVTFQVTYRKHFRVLRVTKCTF